MAIKNHPMETEPKIPPQGNDSDPEPDPTVRDDFEEPSEVDPDKP
jgi:hypothetical protein